MRRPRTPERASRASRAARAPSRPRLDLIAFKVEPDVATILNEMPNKSAFIREAIRSALGQKCPVCAGSGVLTSARIQEFRFLLEALPSVPCRGCGENFPVLPITEDLLRGLPSPDAQRLLQYRQGGPFYCHRCFEKTALCPDCAWYVLADVPDSHGPACARRRRREPEAAGSAASAAPAASRAADHGPA